MPSLTGTISEVCRIPYLNDARLTEIGLDDDGQVDFIEYQASHLMREYPEELEAEIGRPSKKTVISQHLVRFDRKLGKLTAEYFQVGPPMIQDHTLKFRHYSPSFKWSVAGLMKSGGEAGAKPKAFLQIWRDESFVAEIEMSKEHGEFATDEFFGWVGWDEKADLFIYQAEAPEPKPGKADFKYNPPFGEAIPTRRNPMIFVFDLANRKIKNFLNVSEHYTPTQIVYVAKEKAVYFVGYETLPKRYGIMYCLNRPCHLYRWPINGKAVEQMPSARQAPSITYPVYDPHGHRILFMGTHVGGSHYHAFSLYSLDLSNQQVEVLVKDEDMDPERINGLFPIGNPQQTIGKHGTLFVNSFLRTQKTLIAISPSDLRIATPMPVEGEEEKSWKLHQVHENIILASCSSRVSPPRLYVGLVSDRGLIDWFPIIKETSNDLLSGLEQQIHNVDKYVDIIVTRPKEMMINEMPLIIFPHGGPNFSYVSEYSVFSSLAASLGYACAAINYAGSAGYGMESIKALEGQIGTTDVNDVLKAVQFLVEQVGYNKDKMVLYGGSHGGFLVAHLSCRPEYNFKACAAINAVIDLASMAITSDIPDFAWGQLGLHYDLRNPCPPGREIEVMRLCSPSSKVHQAKTPTIVLLGENDLRVPPSQGMAWHTWLKAKGIPTEAYCYPGTGHAIDSPEGEYQELYQAFKFFAKYL